MNALVQAASVWHIQPRFYLDLVNLRQSYIAKVDTQAGDHDWLKRHISLFINQRPEPTLDKSGIGIAHVMGGLAKGLSPLDKMLGMTDYDDIVAEVEELVDRGAKAILLAVDSPGGSVHGLPEAAHFLDALEIPWAVHSSGLVASAAFYLSAGAAFISGTESSVEGSIGTIVPWVDLSGLWEAFGAKWDPVISDGSPLKGIGAGPTLEGEHREEVQRIVNVAKEDFVSHVLNRRDVDPGAMLGQGLDAPEALEAGLIDHIENFNTAYARLAETAAA